MIPNYSQIADINVFKNLEQARVFYDDLGDQIPKILLKEKILLDQNSKRLFDN